MPWKGIFTIDISSVEGLDGGGGVSVKKKNTRRYGSIMNPIILL